MRPDRIVVGEVRGPEALDMLQAMNTGHEGSLSTCHANSPADALRRLETMVLTGSVALPLDAVREQVHAAVDLIVQVARTADGWRGVVEVAEVDTAAVAHGDVGWSRVRTLADRTGLTHLPRRTPRRLAADAGDPRWIVRAPASVRP
jgi:Flp pilus assembly CpaF family ATPase